MKIHALTVVIDVFVCVITVGFDFLVYATAIIRVVVTFQILQLTFLQHDF